MPGLPFTGSQPAPAHLLHEGLTLAFCSHLSFAAAAKSLQSCPTLCNPRDDSPPGFPIPAILQARTLEWVATELINEFRQIAGYKVNIKKQLYFYTPAINNLKKKLRRKILFIAASKRTK